MMRTFSKGNYLLVSFLWMSFVTLGILMSFEMVCTALDSRTVQWRIIYLTLYQTVSGRDFFSLSKHMKTICSDEGLTLETSAFGSLNGG